MKTCEMVLAIENLHSRHKLLISAEGFTVGNHTVMGMQIIYLASLLHFEYIFLDDLKF